MIYGKASPQKAEHHSNETAGHKAGNTDIILRSIGIAQLGEKDPLRTFNQLSFDDFRTAQSRCPKRQIENMMQTERAKHTQDKAINQSADVSRRLHKSANAEYELLKMRPDKEHRHA